MRRRHKAGFTLVELMVVAIIVAILAAVAVPLMSANRRRAMATEAEAGCGSVRTALRVYYAENNALPPSGPVYPNIPGIGANDLDGVYFSTPDYTFVSNGTNTYTITATGNSAGSTAPQKDKVAGVVITLDQDGTFTRTGL